MGGSKSHQAVHVLGFRICALGCRANTYPVSMAVLDSAQRPMRSATTAVTRSRDINMDQDLGCRV